MPTAARVLLLLLLLAACARRGEPPEVVFGAVPPPVSPPEGASPRLDPPPNPRQAGERERAAARADTVASVAIARAAAERAAASGVEAISLLGDTLRRPLLPDEVREEQERLLAAARRDYARDSTADALIWVGRRLGYLGRYNAAVLTFSEGIERFPGDARFLRHRGHRWITLRQFDRAVADLERAAQLVAGMPDETEPDGMPNARGIPTSTLQSNIHYHLGLARYLQGDWAAALGAWNDALAVSRNPDMRVATDYWRYLTLRRLGRDAEAREAIAWVTPDLDIIENTAYHRLLLFFRGLLPLQALQPEGLTAVTDVTVGYGLGVWALLEGRDEEALVRFAQILEGGSWASFGYIAAEAEVARLR